MRLLLAAIVAVSCMASLSGCSHSSTPPVGRWEGVYDDGDTIIAARVEITAKGDVYISAPDALGASASQPADRAAIRARLAQGLNDDWGNVEPRKFDFDGTTFRKPGGIAPQMEWDSSANTMTLTVYLGTRPALSIPLHPVKDFSANPFGTGS